MATISRYVIGHGHYWAYADMFAKAMTRPRRWLEDRVLDLYEGAEYGYKRSHWKGYPKEDLAIIVADGASWDEL